MKVLKQINVDDCWFEWQFSDGKKCDNPPAALRKKKDVFAVVLYAGGQQVYREHRMCCHIDDAWKILAGGRFGRWKNAELLITLRQALRERFVQNMPLEIPRVGIGERELKAWLRLARCHDTVHHGSATF